MQNMLSRERIDLDRYLQLMGKNADEYRQELHPEAIRRIKQRRALELLAEREGMSVTTAEVQQVIDAYNETSPGKKRMRLNQLRASQRISIERSLLRDKAQDWMMQHLTDGTASVTMDADAAATLAILGAEAEGTPAQHVVELASEVTSSATTPATEASSAS
jgi:FKBP-type peptidyl-prolyl cis-trans isomerase (trigger factor)